MGSLVKSRKFWIAIATVVACVIVTVVMLSTKSISAIEAKNDITTAIMVAFGVLSGGIALEDAGNKVALPPPVNASQAVPKDPQL